MEPFYSDKFNWCLSSSGFPIVVKFDIVLQIRETKNPQPKTNN